MDYGGCDCVLRAAPEAKIMQYTGLRDVNQKEIFEGDVVEFEYYVKEGFSREKALVVFSQGMFNIWGDSISDYTCEVIGNIYESPELIKQT